MKTIILSILALSLHAEDKPPTVENIPVPKEIAQGFKDADANWEASQKQMQEVARQNLMAAGARDFMAQLIFKYCEERKATPLPDGSACVLKPSAPATAEK